MFGVILISYESFASSIDKNSIGNLDGLHFLNNSLNNLHNFGISTGLLFNVKNCLSPVLLPYCLSILEINPFILNS